MRILVSERRTYGKYVLVAALCVAVVLSAGTVSKAGAATTVQIKIGQHYPQNCAFYSGGGWKHHVSSNTTKPAFFLPVAGPEIDLVTATGPKRGTAKVFVLDIVTGAQVKVVKFNLRAERSHYKAVRRITGLQKDRLYAAAVVSANGKPVVVDAFKSFLPETSPPDGVVPPPPPEGVTPPGS
jgi:hypothetical protein